LIRHLLAEETLWNAFEGFAGDGQLKRLELALIRYDPLMKDLRKKVGLPE
jgi:hypothetical protein